MQELILDYSSGGIAARLEKSERELVRDVHFTIHEGESLSLIGETGSGKTMIARSILGVLPRNIQSRNACILFCGQALRPGKRLKALLGTGIVYIPQNGLEFLNPSRTVRHHLYDSLRKTGAAASSLGGSALEKLRRAGFSTPEEIIDQYPFQLSGGMAQRVTIALAACSNARLVIADEPTNGLDHAARKSFRALMDSLFPRAAKLIITHDVSVAALCDKTLVLCGGKAVETGSAAALLEAPRHPYTKALMRALITNGMHETPVLRSGPAYCPFYRRCAQAKPECREQMTRHVSGMAEWWCNSV